MDKLFDTAPEIDEAALEQKLLDTILVDDNYLFWRRHVVDFCGWPDADERDRDGDGWDTYCTRCKTYGHIRKKETRPTNRQNCPHCGARVAPAGWRGRHQKQEIRFLYYHFQRGAGREVWVRALDVYYIFGEVGEEHFFWQEAARYRFADGAAQKWRYSFCGGIWQAQKSVTKTTWAVNTNGGYSDHYDAYLELDVDLSGTCLAYAMLREANQLNITVMEYIALYSKYPRVVEALVKTGFTNLVEAKLSPKAGSAAMVNRVINWRAAEYRKIFRAGFDRAELRLLTGKSAEIMHRYRLLRQDDAVRADDASLAYAECINDTEYWGTVLSCCGAAGHKQLRQYYERQSRKSRLAVRTVMHDHADYLGQLAQLGITDGDKLPDDLHEAHERLSMRISRAKKAKENAGFRVRRRLLRWTRFATAEFIIRPIDSETELIREGERQRNCVAGYAGRHKDGTTAILVLRRREHPVENFFTVEYDARHNKIIQCRSYKNRNAEPNVQRKVDAFCARWLDYLQRTHFDRLAQPERRKTA